MANTYVALWSIMNITLRLVTMARLCVKITQLFSAVNSN